MSQSSSPRLKGMDQDTSNSEERKPNTNNSTGLNSSIWSVGSQEAHPDASSSEKQKPNTNKSTSPNSSISSLRPQGMDLGASNSEKQKPNTDKPTGLNSSIWSLRPQGAHPEASSSKMQKPTKDKTTTSHSCNAKLKRTCNIADTVQSLVSALQRICLSDATPTISPTPSHIRKRAFEKVDSSGEETHEGAQRRKRQRREEPYSMSYSRYWNVDARVRERVYRYACRLAVWRAGRGKAGLLGSEEADGESLKESLKGTPEESPKESPKGSPKETLKESTKGSTKKSPKGSSKESSKESRKESSKEPGIKPPKKSPKESSKSVSNSSHHLS